MEEVQKELDKLQQEKEELQHQLDLSKRALSLLAHDIRGISSNLKWVVDSLDNKEVPQDLVFGMLPELKTEVEVNRQATENALQWVKYTAHGKGLNIEPVSVYNLYVALVERLRVLISEKQLRFQYIGDHSLTIQTDAYLISFILTQLLANSIKYSYNGGTVTVSVMNDGRDNIKLSVVDQGMGIEDTTKLFSFDGPRFTGTQGEKGSGLSLIVVKELASLLAIDIWVTSEASETKFELNIPNTFLQKQNT